MASYLYNFGDFLGHCDLYVAKQLNEPTQIASISSVVLVLNLTAKNQQQDTTEFPNFEETPPSANYKRPLSVPRRNFKANRFQNHIVGELTGVPVHPSGIKPHAHFIVPQGLFFQKNHVNKKKFGIQGVYQPFV